MSTPNWPEKTSPFGEAKEDPILSVDKITSKGSRYRASEIQNVLVFIPHIIAT